MTTRLYPCQTPGCYFEGDDGNAWATVRFEGAAQPCDECGTPIVAGYGCWQDGQQLKIVCGAHVEIVRATTAEREGLASEDKDTGRRAGSP